HAAASSASISLVSRRGSSTRSPPSCSTASRRHSRQGPIRDTFHTTNSGPTRTGAAAAGEDACGKKPRHMRTRTRISRPACWRFARGCASGIRSSASAASSASNPWTTTPSSWSASTRWASRRCARNTHGWKLSEKTKDTKETKDAKERPCPRGVARKCRAPFELWTGISGFASFVSFVSFALGRLPGRRPRVFYPRDNPAARQFAIPLQDGPLHGHDECLLCRLPARQPDGRRDRDVFRDQLTIVFGDIDG